jgi:large subunit ribosomal protein L31
MSKSHFHLVFHLELVNFAFLKNNSTAKSVLPKSNKMKQGIHPENYRFVVFKDMSNGESFLSKSTANSKETVLWEDGKEYPIIKLEISNTSHPFYTGKSMLVDTAGRIDKFKKRYAKKD